MDRNGKKEVQKGHTFTIIFKMKIVNDRLTYLDEGNKGLGYGVTCGKQRKKSSVVDFMTGRGKNKTRIKYETPSKVHSESLNNCGINL